MDQPKPPQNDASSIETQVQHPDSGLSASEKQIIEESELSHGQLVQLGGMLGDNFALFNGVFDWLSDGAKDVRLSILRHLCEREQSPTSEAATYDSLEHHTGRSKHTVKHHLQELERVVAEQFPGDDSDAEVAWLGDTTLDKVDELVVARTRRYQQPLAISFTSRDAYDVVSFIGSTVE